MTAATWFDPPPEPERDLWWAAQRIAVPDTDDHTARHRRGVVRLPYDVNDDFGYVEGALVEAWVCCDPACGGVELNWAGLDTNHGCCTLPWLLNQRSAYRGQHRAGLGRIHFTGYYHGEYTAWWEPAAELVQP